MAARRLGKLVARRRGSFSLLVAAGIASASLAQVLPLGPEVIATESTTGRQSRSRLLATPDDGFVLVWHEHVSFKEATIEGRRFDSSGVPVGGDVVLVPFARELESVAADAEGRLVVIWTNSFSGPGGSYPDAVRGSRFTPALAPLGASFVVNSTDLGEYELGESSVAVHPDGHFHVAWENEGGRIQRFRADGARAGTNTELDGPIDYPQIASRTAGGFVGVGLSPTPDACPEALVARRFDLVAQPVGEERVVAPLTECFVDFAVDSSEAGAFVVVWYDGEGSETDVFARRFGSGGEPAGPAFRVNSATAGRQRDPAVEVEATGRFVVTWSSFDPDAGYFSTVEARRFAGDGTPIGGQFRVDSTNAGENAFRPHALVDGAGRLVVAWSQSDLAEEIDVRLRRYLLPFFADGFENGTTSRW